MIDCRQLQVFVSLMETKSFTKTAENIFLTQPTVSGHIKGLEDYLGVKLFDRASKKVIPTDAAKILYPYAKKILGLNKLAKKEISMYKNLEKGSLELGGSNIPGQYILPSYINKFKEKYKNIKISLVIGDTKEIINLVSEGVIELGVVGAVIEDRDLVYKPLWEDELVFIVPKNHPLIDKKELTLDEMVKEKFIIRETGSGTRKFIEEALKKFGYALKNLNIVLEIGSTQGVIQAVKAGIGCAIISKIAVDEELKNKNIFTPKISGVEIKRSFFLVHSNENSLTPAAEEFKKILTNSENN